MAIIYKTTGDFATITASTFGVETDMTYPVGRLDMTFEEMLVNLNICGWLTYGKYNSFTIGKGRYNTTMVKGDTILAFVTEKSTIDNVRTDIILESFIFKKQPNVLCMRTCCELDMLIAPVFIQLVENGLTDRIKGSMYYMSIEDLCRYLESDRPKYTLLGTAVYEDGKVLKFNDGDGRRKDIYFSIDETGTVVSDFINIPFE